MEYTQFVINGFITGSIVSLSAIGFSLIYQTNKFAHFAHGMVVIIGGYFLYSFFSLLKLNFYLSIILAALSTAFFGVFLYILVYKPLKKRKAANSVLLIASIALMIFLENFVLFIFGAGVKSINVIFQQKGIELWGAVITPLQLVIITVSFILLIIIWCFTKYSRIGRMIKAVSDNFELAKITGINTEKIACLGFFIGSFIAGIAGILVALEQNLSPTMGTNLVLKSFAGSVVGGMHSLPGSAFGSYILGFAENIGIIWLPSGYKEAISFIVLILFLLFKPRGIFGIKSR